MGEVAAPAEPAPFLVLPVVETPGGLRRAPGVLAVIVSSFAVVGLGGAWPTVTGWLQATTGDLSDRELWRLLTYVFPHEHGWLHVLVIHGRARLAGLRHVNDKEGLIDPGLGGFLFGFLNHALGMVAGVLLGIAVPWHASRTARTAAGAVALVAAVIALVVGVARWA